MNVCICRIRTAFLQLYCCNLALELSSKPSTTTTGIGKEKRINKLVVFPPSKLKKNHKCQDFQNYGKIQPKGFSQLASTIFGSSPREKSTESHRRCREELDVTTFLWRSIYLIRIAFWLLSIL